MISLIFSFISIITIFITYHISSKRTNIKHDIIYGQRCYKCKNVIDGDMEFDFNTGEIRKIRKICVSCNRDQKLASLTNNKVISKINWQSDKAFNYIFVFYSISILFNLIGVFIKPLGILGSLFLIIGSIYSCKVTLENSIPKKKVQSI